MPPSFRSVLAVYHKDCIDGTVAAAVILKKFPKADVFPLAHNYTRDNIQPIFKKVVGKPVIYTVDCALGVKEFLDAGCSVVVIDHHAGAGFPERK